MSDGFDVTSEDFLDELFPPHNILVTGSSTEENWEAFNILADAKIRFRVEEGQERHTVLAWMSEIPFEGLAGIHDLVIRANRLRSTVERRMKEIMPDVKSDPADLELYQSIYGQQLALAQSRMEEITNTKRAGFS